MHYFVAAAKAGTEADPRHLPLERRPRFFGAEPIDRVADANQGKIVLVVGKQGTRAILRLKQHPI